MRQTSTLATEKLSKSSDMTSKAGLTALLLCMMFGSNAIAVKMSMAGLGVYFAATLRFSLAAIALLLWAAFSKQSLRIKREHIPSIAIISVTFSLQLLLIYVGLSKTTASRSSLFTNLQPFFVLFLAHFFIEGDKIDLRKMVGITLAFTGIFIVFSEESEAGQAFRVGDSLVMLGAFLWACNAVYTKKVIHHFKPIQLALYPMIASIPVSLTGSLLWDSPAISYIDTTILLSLVYQSVIVAAFGYVIWNGLLSRYGAVAVHSFVFVMPITGVWLGGLILKEPISNHLISGLILIVSGLLTIHLKRRKQPPLFPPGRQI